MSGNTINLKDGIKEAPSAHWLLIESYVDKRLVPLLRRLRDNNWRLDALSKEEFTNELMFNYASRVMSILKNVTSILVGKSYVVLNYEVVMFKQNDVENTRFINLVLGLDENGKVWLREISDVSGSMTCEDYNEITTCLISDYSIRRSMGYDHELPNNNAIKETGRYRVQGDVIVEIGTIDINRITSWYEPSVTSLVKWKCLDRFYGELIKHGIDPDLREAYQNPLEPTIGIRLMKRQDERYKSEPEIWRRIENEYFYPLRDFIVKQLSGDGTWTYPVFIEDVRLECHVFSTELETRSQTVTMRIRFNTEDNYLLWQKLGRLLMNHILSDTGSYTYRLGRHEIQVYNVANPITTFQFPETWINDIQYLKPLPPGLMMVPTNHPRIAFVVNRDSKLVIKHPEHGETVLTFDGFYTVEVMTQNKPSTFVGLMNEIAIDKIKQLDRQGGDNQ